ncbi:hypothetical protein CERSUDRAFT_116689 [Gelatoporia subvermispora B]|uniref:Uncharacterized protein n=1 Tax=Ceriporiopsis subvermispora (strain B) TaxID=914234 RepID=M2R7Z5_CERS8|nr:hypothetical protein CERSUDRAFT_116689 [Gelatoporia subvermispora B]
MSSSGEPTSLPPNKTVKLFTLLSGYPAVLGLVLSTVEPPVPARDADDQCARTPALSAKRAVPMRRGDVDHRPARGTRFRLRCVRRAPSLNPPEIWIYRS